MENYLLRFQRRLHKWMLEPGLQSCARVAAYGGSGFFLSAAALAGSFQPLAMGLVTALTGWRALVLAAGAMVGYRVFWGSAGLQGTVWTAAAYILALLAGNSRRTEQMPLLLPALTMVVTAVTGAVFLFFRPGEGLYLFFLRLCLAPVSALFFRRAVKDRDHVTQWICGAVAALALARVGPAGFVLAGAFSLWASFPAAALTGLGLDLAGVSPVPVSAVVCIAWFGRTLPVQENWLRGLFPGAASILVMGLTGIWDPVLLPGLILGGILGHFLPPRQDTVRRQGETGIIQVRLEITAGLMARTQRLLLEVAEEPIDEEALLRRAVDRACGNCVSRESCVERQHLCPEHLHSPLTFACRRPWEIQRELLQSQERLRNLKADRKRRREYRYALAQQYRFLSVYLQKLSDQLPRRGERKEVFYRLEVSARSRGRQRANGDRCLAFPGTGCRYYVLLCDGMGTGLGAAQEGQAAGELLQQMLAAGFPPEHAFRSVNSILALRGQAGAVTLDLAEVRLDSGRVSVYKWGAAPSWVWRSRGAEKIGTAGPPPGIDLETARESVSRLSLRRGEMLILVSDGAEIGESLRRREFGPLPPGELAEWLLKECKDTGEDDATVAVLRLTPRRLST